MLKLDVNMETMFPKTKTPSTSNITFFRFIPENNKGIVGPDTAITSAKRLTSNPAFDTLTSKCSAREGSIPITPISVLIIPKTPIVNMNMSNFFCLTKLFYLLISVIVTAINKKIAFKGQFFTNGSCVMGRINIL
jgi:hypothetical protein